METEIYVTCREQLIAAVLGMAGDGPTPGDPFIVYLSGTRFRISAPKGISGYSARTQIRNIRRTPAEVFRTPKEAISHA